MGKGIKHTSVGSQLTQAEFEDEASHYLASGTSFPASPSEGDLFYRTDEHKWYLYNGSSWKAMGVIKGSWPSAVVINSKSSWQDDVCGDRWTVLLGPVGEFFINKVGILFAGARVFVWNYGTQTDFKAFLGINNLFEGKTVTTVGWATAPTTTANAVDGDLTTTTGEGVTAQTVEDNCYLQVDYGSAVAIKGIIFRVGVRGSTADTSIYFKVKVSADGASWTTIFANAGFYSCTTEKIWTIGAEYSGSIRYIRFTIWKGYTGSGCAKIYHLGGYYDFDAQTLPAGADKGVLLSVDPSTIPSPLEKRSQHAVVRKLTGNTTWSAYYSDPAFTEA